MLIYYLVLAFILVLAFPLCIYKPGVLKKRIYVASVFILLYFIAAFRYGTGNDYFNYLDIYNLYLESTVFFETMNIVSEPAFSFLNWLLSRFTDDIIFVNSVYSLIILVPVAYVISEQSKNVWLSCFLYVCLTFYYTTLNFTRQSMAASFIFLAFFLFSKRKYLFAVSSVVLAVCFHLSAFVFFPIILLCFIKPEKYLFTAYAVLSAVCYFSVDFLFDFGANFLARFIHPRYAYYIGSRFTQSLGWQYVLMPVLCFVIIYLAYNTSWKLSEKNSVLFVNLSFFSAVIWLFITKIMLLERFSMYFYIFTVLSVPSIVNYFIGDFNWIAKRVFSKSTILNNNYNKREKIPHLNIKPHKHIQVFHQTDYDDNGYKLSGLVRLDRNGYYKRKRKKNKLEEEKLQLIKNHSAKKINKALCYSVFGIFTMSCLIYHSYGLIVSGKGFHGVVPYSSGFADIERISTELSGRAKINLLFDADRVYEYLALLTGNDVTVLVSGIPSEKPFLDSVTRAVLKRIGFDYDFKELKSDCVLAVFHNGKKLYEETGKERLEYSTELFGSEIYMVSDFTESRIVIDGVENSLGNIGLNITVLDTEGRIISTVTIYHHDNYGNMIASFKV